MIFGIEFLLSIITLVLLWREDRRRRKYGYGPIWTNMFFQIVVAALTILLVVVFLVEDGEWLVNLVIAYSTDEFAAAICAALITVMGAIMFGMISYLAIIPDDEDAARHQLI
ncbi:hypothetical protein IJH02_03805 [Candidatus Saccharibacteria bacterium]|nr:hypothetical protein [Candidatus Saccharibacteria bacterium]